MSIQFNCPKCQKVLKVQAEMAGKKARCPGCQEVFSVPEVHPRTDAPPTSVPAAPPKPAAKPPASPQQGADAPRSSVPPRPVASGSPSPPSKPPAKPPAPPASPGTKPAPTPTPSQATKPPASPTSTPSQTTKPPASPAPTSSPTAKPPASPASTPSQATKPPASPAPTPSQTTKPPASKSPATRHPPPATPFQPPLDIEELAAQLLADEPKSEAAKETENVPIVLNCFFCDEEISFPADQGGKRAPCPHCRRIIDVPRPVRNEPKDWRKVQRLPSAARPQIEPAPDGAWGGSTSTARVSQEALLEAGVIPRPPLTRRQKIIRYSSAVGAILVIVAGGLSWQHFANQNQQEKALHAAMKYLEKDAAPALGHEQAAEIHRAAGEYFLRANRVEEARDEFRNAQRRLQQVQKGSLDRDAILIETGLAQVDLGGTQEEAIAQVRIKWEVAQKEIQQTLQQLHLPEARAEAAQAAARKLLAKTSEMPGEKLDQRAVALARLLSPTEADVPEMLARVGLEMLRTDRKQAETLAEQASELHKKSRSSAPVKDDKSEAIPPAAPSLLALLLALEQEKKAADFAPAPQIGSSMTMEARVGYALGWAYQGKWEEAQKLAGAPGEGSHRFQALLAVALVAADQSKPEVLRDVLTSAAGLVTEKDLSPWLQYQFVRCSARAGTTDPLRPWIDKLPAGELKRLAQMEVLRADLAARTQTGEESLKNELEKGDQASPRTVEALARWNASHGSSASLRKSISSWEPETLRPFGHIGMALGLQDAE